nr:L,D-transpeptidase family protein [Desulfurobacterium thermolithotrophum]
MLKFLLVFFLAFSFLTARGESLYELVKKIDILTPEEISKEIRNLSPEERFKLQLLLFSYAGESKEVRKLIKKAYPKRLISNVLILPPSINAIIVDKTREILYVIKMDKGIPHVIKKFPCITGKKLGDKLEEGDLRTPEGIYFPLYWKRNLPKLYGIGAFPLNYPNLIDKKVLKRNGHGIWIHGTNNPNRPPHSTNGCIVLKNEYLKELKKLIDPKLTPVIIVTAVNYVERKKYIDEKKSILSFILRWKKAWENTPKSLKSYFSFYSKHFVWKKGNYKDWIRYKKRVTKQKKWIKIKIFNLSVSKDGRVLQFGNLYVANIDFEYKSNNFHSKGKKLLYIVREGKQWKILGEENL